MLVQDAQNEVRAVYRSGMVGQTVSGIIWLVSAALATWASRPAGVIALVLGGFFIFPLTQAVLRAMGGTGSLSKGNPFFHLAWQTAFIAPLGLPVVAAAASHAPNWFYPAFMIIVGAHYLPFITLYGMVEFGALAAVLLGLGTALGMLGVDSFTLGGWLTGGVLLAFALFVWVRRERKG